MATKQSPNANSNPRTSIEPTISSRGDDNNKNNKSRNSNSDGDNDDDDDDYYKALEA